MTIETCDGCRKTLDRKVDTYYTVGDLDKHVPRTPYRLLVKHQDVEVKAEDTGWISYPDLHYCTTCVQGPIDIGPHLRKPEA